jgi:hypothetical protein
MEEKAVWAAVVKTGAQAGRAVREERPATTEGATTLHEAVTVDRVATAGTAVKAVKAVGAGTAVAVATFELV